MSHRGVFNDDGAYECLRGHPIRPGQYCAMDEGYSRDLETFNFTLVLYITKRGPACDVPEDTSTNTNTIPIKKRYLQHKSNPQQAASAVSASNLSHSVELEAL